MADIPAGRELDTAIALAFPELQAKFVAVALAPDGASCQHGTPMAYEECKARCLTIDQWVDVPYKPQSAVRFSLHIAEAWKLMERFATEDPITGEGYFCKVFSGMGEDDSPWVATIEHSLSTKTWYGKGKTGAEAICRAALHAAADVPEMTETQERYNEGWKEEYPKQWAAIQAKLVAAGGPEKIQSGV